MSAQIPTIETPRLMLRPFVVDDTNALRAILAEPGILRYFPRADPPSKEQVARMICHQIAHWKEHRLGWWAVELAGSPALIGWCGLQYLPETAEVEVAYLLDKAHWGRGLATEAARAAVNYGFADLGLQTIIALVHPENTASQRVIEKLGMVFIDEATYFGMELRRYSLARASTADPRAV